MSPVWMSKSLNTVLIPKSWNPNFLHTSRRAFPDSMRHRGDIGRQMQGGDGSAPSVA